MENKEYQERALALENKDYDLIISRLVKDPVLTLTLLRTLEATRKQLNLIDQLKKALIYGKESLYVEKVRETTKKEYLEDTEVVAENDQLISALLKDHRLVRLLHGVLGKSSEQEEMIEALQGSLLTGKIDSVNWLEEIGDDAWYSALLCDVFSFSFEKIQAANIAKLEERYKITKGQKGFNAEATINRDVDVERKILEENAKLN